MLTCYTDPRAIIAKAYDALLPGGHLELQDGVFPMQSHDSSLAGTAFEKWNLACVEAAALLGRPWTNTPFLKGWMDEIGFESVTEKVYEVPISPWASGKKEKEVGLWLQADLLDAVGATTKLLTHALGWELMEVERLLVDVRKDISNRKVHAYMPVSVVDILAVSLKALLTTSSHIIWGRKPATPQQALDKDEN